MARICFDDDADMAVLLGKRIGIIGYGNQGRAQALNMRDSGIRDILITTAKDATFDQAREDGFQVLERLKANDEWRDIPVNIISPMNDIDSVVQGIKLGTEEYLPKPVDEVLPQARIEASLEKKRFRDQELAYLRQVERLTAAAKAVERSYSVWGGKGVRPSSYISVAIPLQQVRIIAPC